MKRQASNVVKPHPTEDVGSRECLSFIFTIGCGGMTTETFESLLTLWSLCSSMPTPSSSSSSSSFSCSLRLCYQHQLYCMHPNRNRVDEDVKILSKEQNGESPVIKMLYSHTSPTDTLLCRFDEYKTSVENLRDVIESSATFTRGGTKEGNIEEEEEERVLKVQAINKFLVYALKDNKMSLFGDYLRKGSANEKDNLPLMTDKEIDLLNDLKLLVPRRDTYSTADCYWVSHPAIGQFSSRVLKARAAILQRVKTMKYKEIAESILEQKFSEQSNGGRKGKGSKRKHASLIDDSSGLDGAGYLTNNSLPSVAALYSSLSNTSSLVMPQHSALTYGFKFHLFDLVGKESLTRHPIPSIDNQKKYMIRLPP